MAFINCLSVCFDLPELLLQFRRDAGDVFALEARHGEFFCAGLARSIGAGDGPRAVRRAAPNFADVRQLGAGVGQPGVDHAVVQQSRDEREDGGFVAATDAGAGKNAGDLANERAAHPQAAGLVEKIAHLRRHVAEARRRAEDDGVIVAEFLGRSDGRRLVNLRAVLQRVEEALKKARAVATGGRGELHVGYAPSLTVRILPPTLRAFQAESPNVRVLLHDLSTEEMLARLRDGALQIAFLVRPTRTMLLELRLEELLRDSLCLAVAPKHPLARRRTVRLAEVAREPLIAYSRKEYPEYHELLAELFATIKSKPPVAEEHDGITSLVAAVEAGGGVALVSESVACLAGPRLKLIPLSPAPVPLVTGAAWSERGLAPAAERFLKCAKDTVLKK